jgi:hypothetical protein
MQALPVPSREPKAPHGGSASPSLAYMALRKSAEKPLGFSKGRSGDIAFLMSWDEIIAWAGGVWAFAAVVWASYSTGRVSTLWKPLTEKERREGKKLQRRS